MNNFDYQKELARLTAFAAIQKAMIASNPEKYIKQADDRYNQLLAVFEDVERALSPLSLIHI